MQLDIMSSSDETQVAESEVTNSTGSCVDKRKSSKPIMEKRRRARINNSLNQLKAILLEALKKDSTRHSKLEKADILEMTVSYLKNVERQRLSMSLSIDPSVMDKYKAGFNECRNEVMRFLSTCEGVHVDVRTRLLSHLASCIRCIHSLQTQSNVFDDSGFDFLSHQAPFVLNGNTHGHHVSDPPQGPNPILSPGSRVDGKARLVTNFPECVSPAVSRRDISFVPSSFVGHSSFFPASSPPLGSPPLCSRLEKQIPSQTVPITPPKADISPPITPVNPTEQSPTKSTGSGSGHSPVTAFLPFVSQPKIPVTKGMTNAVTQTQKNGTSQALKNCTGRQRSSLSSEENLSECDNEANSGCFRAEFEDWSNCNDAKHAPMRRESNDKEEHKIYEQRTLKRRIQGVRTDEKMKRSHLSKTDSEPSKNHFASPTNGSIKPMSTTYNHDPGQTYFSPRTELTEQNRNLRVFHQDIRNAGLNENKPNAKSKRPNFDINNNTGEILTYTKSPKKSNTKKNNPWRPWSDNNGST